MSTPQKYTSFLLMAIFVMTIIAIAFPNREAYAGSNGQQLQVRFIPISNAKVTVYGFNQSGKAVTWIGYAKGQTAKTTGYWWIGTVEIRVLVNNQVVYACHKNVIKNQWFSDWVSASMNTWRSDRTTPTYACP